MINDPTFKEFTSLVECFNFEGESSYVKVKYCTATNLKYF